MTLLISPESFVMLSSCVILQSGIIKNPFFTAFHKHNELSDYHIHDSVEYIFIEYIFVEYIFVGKLKLFKMHV